MRRYNHAAEEERRPKVLSNMCGRKHLQAPNPISPMLRRTEQDTTGLHLRQCSL